MTTPGRTGARPLRPPLLGGEFGDVLLKEVCYVKAYCYVEL
jgi:hypothetical protein